MSSAEMIEHEFLVAKGWPIGTPVGHVREAIEFALEKIHETRSSHAPEDFYRLFDDGYPFGPDKKDNPERPYREASDDDLIRELVERGVLKMREE